MQLKKFIINTPSIFLGLLAVLISSAAHASDYSVTPFAGYRISDSLDDELTMSTVDIDEASSFGFILSARRDGRSTYDFLFSRQDSVFQSANSPANALGVRLDHYHIGGTVNYRTDNLRPFASGGLGLTRILVSNPTYSNETRFSISLGGGLKFPINDDIALRVEGRAFGTTINSNGSIVCTNGSCVAKFSGNFFLQFEVSAGLSIAF